MSASCFVLCGMMVGMKTMTRKQAIKQAHETELRLQAEIESGRVADRQRNRLQYQTSICCGHDGQSYITIAEFDFQLCARCQAMIVKALVLDLEISKNGTATR